MACNTVVLVAMGLATVSYSSSVSAQTPAPFPRPGQTSSRPPSQPPPTQPASPAAPVAQVPATSGDPGDLGVPIYPESQFITSYDAGRGQRYYLYGAEADFLQ